MDSSLIRTVSIIAFIIVISGKHDGLSDAKYRICYETHLIDFCDDLTPSENMTSYNLTSWSDGDFNVNLVLQIPNVTKLDMSMNAISNLRFNEAGTVDLKIDLVCIVSEACFMSDEKCQHPEKICKYFKFNYHEQLKNSNVVNFTRSIQTLILSKNSIHNLNLIFTPLENLEYLDLSYNLIEDLSDQAFANNSKLVTLKLNKNKIESLRKETFEHLRNLQTLDLSSNRFARLNLDIFEFLNDLLVLQISDNFHFANGLPESSSFIFSAGQKFERLEMCGTSLTKIPIVLTRSIRELDLSNNSLVSIHCGEMDSYPLLQRLSLQNNLLEIVEEDSLGRLEYLTELNLHGNSLHEIPLSLPLGLLWLDLSFNQIKDINKTNLDGLSHLRTLILKDNKIKHIEESAFSQVVSLEYLDLSNNPIKILTSSHFAGPKGMTNIQLSNLSQLSCGGIKSCINTFPVTELERLEVLNLSSSPLLSQQINLDQSVIPALGRLRELNLVNTNLTGLNSHLVNHLRRLQKLDVHHNPFNCSNNVVWLKDWLITLQKNNSRESRLKNQSKNVNDSDLNTRSFATIRVIVPKYKNATKEGLKTTIENDWQTIPRCFLPARLRGKSLFDVPVEDLKNAKLIPQRMDSSLIHIVQKSDLGEPEKESTSRDKIDAMKTAYEKTSSERKNGSKIVPLTLINVKSAAKESSSDEIERTDQGKLVSNSILPTIERSNDEVFYQNDEPDSSTVASRTKSRPTVVRNFDILLGQEIQYVTVQPKVMKKTEDSRATSDGHYKNITMNQTSSQQEKGKILKQEVKSINKTHIEISRSSLKSRNLDSVAPKMGSKFDGMEEKTTVKSPEKPLKNINILQTHVENQESQLQRTELTTEMPKIQGFTEYVTDSDKHSTTSTSSTPSDAILPNRLSEDSAIAPTPTIERKTHRMERQHVTKTQISSQVSQADQTHQKDLASTPTLVGKSKPPDETFESISKQTRKKLAKKLKDITTDQPRTVLPFISQIDLTTNSTLKGQIKTDDSETQTSRKGTYRKPKCENVRSYLSYNNTSETLTISENKTSENCNNDNGNSFINEGSETDKKIQHSDSVTASKIGDDGKIDEKGKDAVGNSKEDKTVKKGKNSNSLNRSKNKVPVKNHTSDDDDKRGDAANSYKESSPCKKTKQSDLINADKYKISGKNESNQNGDVSKENHRDIVDHDNDRNSINTDLTKGSDARSNAMNDKLRLNNNVSHKIQTSVDKKLTLNKHSAANAKKCNCNSESKDDIDKGRHPGMLIFLLLVSVLLLTFYFIYHWTLFKQIKKYELSDQQILEESDYEINSLTNFKDEERW